MLPHLVLLASLALLVSPAATRAPAPAPSPLRANATALDPQTRSLLLLKAAIDRNGTLTAWTPDTSPCTWYGVRCDAGGNVTEIALPGLKLDGELPLDARVWGGLQSLRTLDLSSNKLTGFLPPQLDALKGVERVNLLGNGLQGPLPTGLGALPRLENVVLSRNNLTGALPADWANATTLRVVDVSSNKLSGGLPPAWSSLSQLRLLNVSNNGLSGGVPTGWRPPPDGAGGMESLKEAALGGNTGLCETASKKNGTFAPPDFYNGPCAPAGEVAPVDPAKLKREPRLVSNQGAKAGTDPDGLRQAEKAEKPVTVALVAPPPGVANKSEAVISILPSNSSLPPGAQPIFKDGKATGSKAAVAPRPAPAPAPAPPAKKEETKVVEKKEEKKVEASPPPPPPPPPKPTPPPPPPQAVTVDLGPSVTRDQVAGREADVAAALARIAGVPSDALAVSLGGGAGRRRAAARRLAQAEAPSTPPPPPPSSPVKLTANFTGPDAAASAKRLRAALASGAFADALRSLGINVPLPRRAPLEPNRGGKIAAIVIGCVVGVALLAALAAFTGRSARRSASARAADRTLYSHKANPIFEGDAERGGGRGGGRRGDDYEVVSGAAGGGAKRAPAAPATTAKSGGAGAASSNATAVTAAAAATAGGAGASATAASPSSEKTGWFGRRKKDAAADDATNSFHSPAASRSASFRSARSDGTFASARSDGVADAPTRNRGNPAVRAAAAVGGLVTAPLRAATRGRTQDAGPRSRPLEAADMASAQGSPVGSPPPDARTRPTLAARLEAAAERRRARRAEREAAEGV